MTGSITFFPVDNGDMTLVRLSDPQESRILIDCHIRTAADDQDSPCRDVSRDLRSRLPTDALGRPFVHVFMLSHPDQDHCSGLRRHFWLGPIADYPDDDIKQNEKRIVIHELWSSPMVFRRASKKHTLCDDARAFNAEARRRVRVNRDERFICVEAGDRILVLGEDQGGKTDDLGPILVRTDETFNRIGGEASQYFSARLLAPRPPQDDDTETLLSKNNSSIVLNIHLAEDFGATDACRFLTGGDADVAVWERLWTRYQGEPDALSYDVMQAPHHCSWHCLSYDSWSDFGEEAEVSLDARSALGQALKGAFIIASCKPIDDDDCDPPCVRAKREYVAIVGAADGKFYCTGEHRSRRAPEPLEFRISRHGPYLAVTAAAAGVMGTTQRAG
jgi:hypothetical protein